MGYYYAIEFNGEIGSNQIRKSFDFTSWENVYTGTDEQANHFTNIIVANNKLIVSGSDDLGSGDYASAIRHSTNGSTWGKNRVANNPYSVIGTIAYSPSLNIYVVSDGFLTASAERSGSRIIWSSSNLVDWTIRYNGGVGKFGSIKWITTLSLFIAVGRDNVGASTIVTSSDGLTWSLATIDISIGNIFDFDYDGTTIKAIGGSGYLLSSSDGLTWTLSTIVNSVSGLGIACNSDGSIWVTVSDQEIYSSINGGSFIVRTAISGTRSLQRVRFLNNIFIVTDAHILGLGRIFTSSDGITWTEKTNVGMDVSDIIYADLGVMQINEIELYPRSDYLIRAQIDKNNYRMLNGDLYQQNISGTKQRRWELPLFFVSSSDATQINSWWVARTTVAYNEGDAISYNVKIVNAYTPLEQFEDEYKNTFYKGELILETI